MGSGLLPPLRIIWGGEGEEVVWEAYRYALVSIGHQEDEG